MSRIKFGRSRKLFSKTGPLEQFFKFPLPKEFLYQILIEIGQLVLKKMFKISG
jgi:hypothetical protein